MLIAAISLFTSCSTESLLTDSSTESTLTNEGGGQFENEQSGLITAAEWRDLENWDYWKEVITYETISELPSYWKFYNNNRVSILLQSNNQPVIDVSVQLIKDEAVIWESKTDNFGKAELWIDLFYENNSIDMNEYSLKLNNEPIDFSLKLFSEGINEIEFESNQNRPSSVELSFIVDATGSMSDEIKFLQDDLNDVIQRVKSENSSINISTSTVFYRDEGDDYLVRSSDFTTDTNNTINFIKDQQAGGGGDYPEAVHTGLKVAIEDFQWSENAGARIAFLILDAPPHYEPDVILQLQQTITEAARKGIKIIPISASGIDKKTEFLMRFFSISTNSTYVFITNDSGIGNDHIEATVGEHEVEYLNDLMVRLIKEYSEY